MFYNMFPLFTGIRWNLPFFHQFPAVCKQTKFAACAPDIYAKTILLHVFPLPAASDRLLPRQTPPFFFFLCPHYRTDPYCGTITQLGFILPYLFFSVSFQSPCTVIQSHLHSHARLLSHLSPGYWYSYPRLAVT